MNLLYITAVWTEDGESNMHLDFVKQAAAEGINVTVLALCEERLGIETNYKKYENFDIVHVHCGNIQKTNKYKKVISSVMANLQMVHAANKYLKKRTFDVCVWSVSTTLIYVGVRMLKEKFKAAEYLLLKEYWPQDPVDLGAMREGGAVYSVLKHAERSMLQAADYIGTSSEAGTKYVIDRYPENSSKCEVCPHCEEAVVIDKTDKKAVLKSYGLPENKTIFIYGGNFGVSQGIDDMISCISTASAVEDAYFVLLGSGTEYMKVKKHFENYENVRFMGGMKHSEFLRLASACDAGMIFLFKDYNVPNIPGKLNTYLNAEVPIIACVDRTTDLGDIISEGGAGIKVRSGDAAGFKAAVEKLQDESLRREMSENAKKLLYEKYTPDKTVSIIKNHFIQESL
ncbi:MAG: glycosyltransferase family 4 protein [Clostridia bacterium]|nr:glycosyltransferase family 4 protein [Clostridia bacterium]